MMTTRVHIKKDQKRIALKIQFEIYVLNVREGIKKSLGKAEIFLFSFA